jgi:soluble lytic murein transglycosylase-like protein
MRALGAALLLIGGAVAGLARRVRQTPEYTPPQAPAEFALPEAPPPLPPAAPRPAGRLRPEDVAAIVNPAWGVPLDEVLAYCEIESSFHPRAYRFERHLNEASYGLMQVLESTARDRGLIGPPENLYEPEIGLEIGCAHVIWTQNFLASRGAPSDPLSVALAYNAGVGNALRGRVVQAYGVKWNNARARYARAFYGA